MKWTVPRKSRSTLSIVDLWQSFKADRSWSINRSRETVERAGQLNCQRVLADCFESNSYRCSLKFQVPWPDRCFPKKTRTHRNNELHHGNISSEIKKIDRKNRNPQIKVHLHPMKIFVSRLWWNEDVSSFPDQLTGSSSIYRWKGCWWWWRWFQRLESLLLRSLAELGSGREIDKCSQRTFKTSIDSIDSDDNQVNQGIQVTCHQQSSQVNQQVCSC